MKFERFLSYRRRKKVQFKGTSPQYDHSNNYCDEHTLANRNKKVVSNETFPYKKATYNSFSITLSCIVKMSSVKETISLLFKLCSRHCSKMS